VFIFWFPGLLLKDKSHFHWMVNVEEGEEFRVVAVSNAIL
jgi:hypothetical protein